MLYKLPPIKSSIKVLIKSQNQTQITVGQNYRSIYIYISNLIQIFLRRFIKDFLKYVQDPCRQINQISQPILATVPNQISERERESILP